MPALDPDGRLGCMLVLSAPSGTGKSTLLAHLRKTFPELRFSVSATTRAPRPGDIPGVTYHFMDRADFLKKAEAGYFAEWAEVYGNLYGTPRQAVADMLEQGEDVLFDVDVQGAASLRMHFPQAAFVFVLPPSAQELVRRLTGRGTDDPETIKKRLASAKSELEKAGEFGYWLVNDELQKACDELEAILKAERLKPRLRPGLDHALLEQFQALATVEIHQGLTDD